MENCINRQECDACKVLYDEKIANLDHRVDNLETDIKQIHSLTVSVEKMAVSLEMMAKELAKQGERLDAIEAEPGKKWKQAVWLVVAGLIGAVLTFFLTKIGITG